LHRLGSDKLPRRKRLLISGFATAITKNAVIHDEHFRECVTTVREVLSGEKPGPGGRKDNYLQHKTYPDEIPEELLRDRLIEWLTNNPMQQRVHVAKEYVVAGGHRLGRS
jgi:hypothetical protein